MDSAPFAAQLEALTAAPTWAERGHFLVALGEVPGVTPSAACGPCYDELACSLEEYFMGKSLDGARARRAVCTAPCSGKQGIPTELARAARRAQLLRRRRTAVAHVRVAAAGAPNGDQGRAPVRREEGRSGEFLQGPVKGRFRLPASHQSLPWPARAGALGGDLVLRGGGGGGRRGGLAHAGAPPL